MSNRFYNRDMKPYRSNQAINPSKIAEIFSSISNMDTQEITNTANRLQIPLGVTDENGDTLIHKILKDETKQKNEVNRLNIIEFLYNNNVSPDSPNKENVTPLHLACYYQYPLIIKYLIEIGADPNYKDILGNTAFHYYLNGLLRNYINNFIIDLIPQENLPKLKEGIKTNAIEKRIFNQISTDPLIDTLKNTIIKSTGLNEDLEFEFNEYLKKTTGPRESENIKEFNETVNNFFTSISEKIKNLWSQFNDIDEIELHIKNDSSWPNNLPNTTQAVIKDLVNGNVHDTIREKIKGYVNDIVTKLTKFTKDVNDPEKKVVVKFVEEDLDDIKKPYTNPNTGAVPFAAVAFNLEAHRELYKRELLDGCADGADNFVDLKSKIFIGGARRLNFEYVPGGGNLENILDNLFQQNPVVILKTLAKTCIDPNIPNVFNPIFVNNANPLFMLDKIVYTLLMTSDNIRDNEVSTAALPNATPEKKWTRRVYEINKNNDKLDNFHRMYNLVLNKYSNYTAANPVNRDRLTPTISEVTMYFFAGYINYQTDMMLSMTQAMKTLLIRRLVAGGNQLTGYLLLSSWIYLLLSKSNYHNLFDLVNSLKNDGNLNRLDLTLGNDDFIPAIIANYCLQLFTNPGADPGLVAGINLTDELRKFTGINYTNRYEMLVYAITKYNEQMNQKPIQNHVIDTIFIIRKTYSERNARHNDIISNYIQSLDLGIIPNEGANHLVFFNEKVKPDSGQSKREKKN